MTRLGRALLAAVTFLTVLPIGRTIALDGEDVARGSVLFPIVGAGIGAVTGGTAWVLGDHLSPLLAAVLAVLVGTVVTGALHLDGLADCADGFGARTPEDRLRVMRDHTNGTYGGTALLLDLMIRTAVLASLAGSSRAMTVAAAAGALSRVSGPVLAAWLPYAQAKPGAGEALSAQRSSSRAILAVIMGIVVAAGCVQLKVLVALPVAALVILLVGMTSMRRLRGVTGDVMGASSELVELAVLVVLVVLVGMR